VRGENIRIGGLFVGRWMNDIYASSFLSIGKDGEGKQIKVYIPGRILTTIVFAGTFVLFYYHFRYRSLQLQETKDIPGS
jgi:hypothetical protein